jgi:hypothetical protein
MFFLGGGGGEVGRGAVSYLWNLAFRAGGGGMSVLGERMLTSWLMLKLNYW